MSDLVSFPDGTSCSSISFRRACSATISAVQVAIMAGSAPASRAARYCLSLLLQTPSFLFAVSRCAARCGSSPASCRRSMVRSRRAGVNRSSSQSSRRS